MMLEFDEQFGQSNKNKLVASAKKFEAMIAKNDDVYFDEETFENLTEYFLTHGKNDLAEKACSLGLQKYPYSLELLLNSVQLKMNEGNFDQALELINDVRVFFPSDPEVIVFKGMILNQLGNYEEALEIFESNLPLTEDKGLLYFQIAQTYQNLGSYRKAIEALKQVIHYDPKNDLAFYELIFSLEFVGELENSIPYFNTLIDKDPYSAYTWYCLGMIYTRTQQYENAEQAYEYSTIVDKNYIQGWFHLQ